MKPKVNFENINKVHKILARLRKKKTQMCKASNEYWDISTNSTEIRRIR